MPPAWPNRAEANLAGSLAWPETAWGGRGKEKKMVASRSPKSLNFFLHKAYVCGLWAGLRRPFARYRDNPVDYSDRTRHMPKWWEWAVGHVFVVGAIAESLFGD